MKIERTRRGLGSPQRQIASSKPKKTVSVATIFRQKPCQTKQVNSASQTNSKTPEVTADKASIVRSRITRSLSSSHDGHKTYAGVTKRRSDMHPLAVSFKDTSESYRQHLFDTARLRINQTLITLRNRLYESTLQKVVPTATQQDTQASPLKLTASVKYERLALKLYQPLSLYQLKVSSVDKEGKRVYSNTTLETRMAGYRKHLANRAERVTQLQQEWEKTVAEIWKLGVHCLGETAMENLLFKQKTVVAASLPASPPLHPRHVSTETTLFVPEQGISPGSRTETRTSKKHVTFDTRAAPNDYVPASLSQFPDFLYQSPRLGKNDMPALPQLPEQDIKDLAARVEELGKEQIEQLRDIARDRDEYWKRKNKQLALALRSD